MNLLPRLRKVGTVACTMHYSDDLHATIVRNAVNNAISLDNNLAYMILVSRFGRGSAHMRKSCQPIDGGYYSFDKLCSVERRVLRNIVP